MKVIRDSLSVIDTNRWTILLLGTYEPTHIEITYGYPTLIEPLCCAQPPRILHTNELLYSLLSLLLSVSWPDLSSQLCLSHACKAAQTSGRPGWRGWKACLARAERTYLAAGSPALRGRQSRIGRLDSLLGEVGKPKSPGWQARLARLQSPCHVAGNSAGEAGKRSLSS